MNRFQRCLSAAVAVAVASPAWGLNIEPGEWTTTTVMQSPGMPQGQKSTKTQCITKEDAEKDFLAGLADKKSPCKIISQKESGDTLEFEMECPNQMGSAKAKGTFTANGSSGTGKMDMTMVVQGNTMSFSQTFESKRTGPCK